MQRNWIGKSTGANVKFELCDSAAGSVSVFTTRLDVLLGVSFVAVSPKHELATAAPNDQTEAWLTGRSVRHPVTGVEIPLVASKHVIAGHAEGAVSTSPSA